MVPSRTAALAGAAMLDDAPPAESPLEE